MEAAVSFICPWRLVCVIFLLPILQAVLNPEGFPNLLAGSFTDGNRLSTGNTLPLVGHPWGFNHWSPQTRDANRYTGSWWFSGSDHTLTWMRCTHQPSPWIGDWGSFVFVPQIGDVTRSPQYIWQPRGALIKPYLFDATLAPVNLRLELTATNHGAMLRVTFPATTEWGDKFICFAGLSFQDHGGANGGFFLAAVSNEVHVDRMLVNNFNHYLRAESVEATGVISRDDLMCFQYKREATVVHVRMATSLISASQAVTNLQREIPSSATFDQTLLENKLVWNRLMRRVNVIDAGDLSERSSRHLTVFYTGLYRALTFPRRIDEVDSNGKVIHYSPYDVHGRTYSGPLVTDNGFWDTYRTVYPLLSLLYPDHLGVIVQGWLNAYKEGGWLPSWASPGYRNCMVGTFADVVIADAIVKDVPGFDIRLAIEALSKDAFENPPGYAGGAVGKEGLREYAERGYLPRELGGEIVSRTLDYGFADFSTALSFLYLSQSLAEKLPSESDVGQLKEVLLQKAKTLFRRAVSAFRSSFDQRRGLMLPKSRNGDFSDRFSPIEWGNGYTEGNAWHHSFPAYSVICPFLDVNNGFIAQLKAKSPEFSDLLKCENGLMALYGGRGGGSEELLKKLYQLLHVRSRFEVGSYGQEIHEMTESVTLAIGQYAHNNQPVHHILYLFALLGDPRTTQRLTSEVMNRGYGIDFFSGDEDNGEQGAWFVLSALGLYSISPGSLDYVVSRPLFRHVRIAHPKASHATEEVNEGMLEDYLDLFAYSTIPTRTSTKPSPSHFVHKVSVLSGKDGEGEVATIGSQQHFLISDRILQGNHILQFHYEDAEQTSDFPAQYQQLVKLLHSKPTRDLDRHQYQDFTSPPPTSSSETSSKSTVSESSLRLKLREQEKEIADLKKRLSGDSAFSHIGKIDEIRGDIPRTTASIWVFYVVLGIGFLLALAMAKLLEIAGCAEIGGGEGGSGFGCTSSYYFVVGFFRRTFLLVRSFYSRFSGNSSGGSNNEAEFIPTWSLKSQAHTV